MYTVYKITNLINERYYIGVHKTDDPNDLYMGSGPAIKSAIQKYGVENFTKDILYTFDDSESAYQMEHDLLESCLQDAQCYNMNSGGKGGWDYVNSLNLPNSMKDPEVVQRNLESRRSNGNWFTESKRQASLANLSKAVEYNTGRKRPEHSALMKEKSSLNEMWKDKDGMRDKLSSEFTVVDPEGNVYNTNRLQEFCEDRNLTYVSVWNTSRTGKPVKKGKAKGWMCKLKENV